MNPYPYLADAAWIRLAIVGIDILAVMVVARMYAMLTIWWRTPRKPQPVPATVRLPERSLGRRPTRH